MIWVLGWAWAIAGLVGGALFAPSVAQFLGLAHSAYSDWIVIVVAILAGFFVQLLGWLVAIVGFTAISFAEGFFDIDIGAPGWLSTPLFLVIAPLPMVVVGYGIIRYLNWVGPGKREVTIAFVGALVVKSF
jgi:hypothetical protein